MCFFSSFLLISSFTPFGCAWLHLLPHWLCTNHACHFSPLFINLKSSNTPTTPGGVLKISRDRDDSMFAFLGLKFLIPVFFWVGKFGKYFWGGLF